MDVIAESSYLIPILSFSIVGYHGKWGRGGQSLTAGVASKYTYDRIVQTYLRKTNHDQHST